MSKCIICGNEYKAKRSTSRYCGAKCRKLAFQKVAENAKPGTVIPVEKKTSSESELRDDIDCFAGKTETPEGLKAQVPANYGQADCECMQCQAGRRRGSLYIFNHGAYKSISELGDNEFNRIALPGDVDYEGICLAEKYKSRKPADEPSPQCGRH